MSELAACREGIHTHMIYPVVPVGKMAVSIAIFPCNTRVNALFSSSVGVPKCYGRDECIDV